MHQGPASKKLRLDTSNRHKRNLPFTSFDTFDNPNDGELWGDDLNLDDEVMQQIESQALSQFQEVPPETPFNRFGHNPDFQTSTINDNSSSLEKLRLDLQAKQGEVKNLRLEQDSLKKDFKNQLDLKDELIESLKKQLSEKQSEIEFQKMEKLTQNCRTPKLVRVQQNANSPFYERFQFTQKKMSSKDTKIFNFRSQLNKGDVLYKLLKSVFVINSENENISYQDFEKENEFTLYLNCCLLQLCRYTSFEKMNALDLIKLIIFKSRDLLVRFSKKLSAKEVKFEYNREKSKVITLPRIEDVSYKTNQKYSLLSNNKWFCNEKGVAVRQTITTLAKLMMIEPLVVRMLIEDDFSSKNGMKCRCIDRRKISSNQNEDQLVDFLENEQPNLLINGNVEDLNLYATSKKVEVIFDIIELFDKMVQEIFIRKPHKYEGVFSAIMYFCSILCGNSENRISEKHKKHIVNIFQKMLFSLPGFIVIRYMVEFLNASTQYNFSDALCHRSAAETFSENFRSFCFTEDTCMLQVLCAHIEMIHKSPYFLDVFTSWVLKMATGFHRISWMNNETDSKLCECLPALEQIFIRIMLHSIEEYDKEDLSIAEESIFNTSVKRCSAILKQFRWQDCQFSIHIANCKKEYEMLLSRLAEISEDEAVIRFVSKEHEVLADNVYEFDLKTNSELITCMRHFTIFPKDNS